VDGNSAGSDGGGIDLYDTPTTISRSTIANNQGGRSGGGIDHYRNTLTLNNVTVSGNSTSGNAASGGGIDNDSGLLIVDNSTLDHNSSSQQGGGIYNESDSISNLTNATLSANVAITGGGIYNEAGFVDPAIITLTNVTLKDNRATAGGGIFNANDPLDFFFLKNTIIADSPSGGNCKGKAFTSSKYSLSSDMTCALAGAGNHNNTPAQLLALANVGGPTKTHLPKPTSPAVDGVGGSDCPGTDQRGFGRPVGASCDIGSVERQLSDPAVVPILYLPLIVR